MNKELQFIDFPEEVTINPKRLSLKRRGQNEESYQSSGYIAGWWSLS